VAGGLETLVELLKGEGSDTVRRELGGLMAGPTRRDQPGFFGHPLAYVWAERGWTYQDLVDVIARRVGNMATRREKAWRWEHWGVVPDEESQYALAAELGVPRELVGRLGWPAWLPAGDRLNVELPWSVEASLGMLDHTAGAAQTTDLTPVLSSQGE
jgi:hypothetical protein